MYKVGIVGEGDSVFIFKLLGIDIFSCNSSEEAKKILDKLVFENYAVIFITETMAKGIEDIIIRYQKRYIPSIVLIPSSKGSLGIGIGNINDNVEKAIGVNIL